MVGGQSSSGEDVVRPEVVYVGLEKVSGLIVSSGGVLWRAARLLEESRAEGSMRFCPGRPGCPGANWSKRRAW